MEIDEKNYLAHINVLPSETVGQVLEKLSVVDRLQCEGVNPRWKAITWELGWTEQRKLSAEIVFEGVNDRQKAKFATESFVALFHRINVNLTELDLKGFPIRSIYLFRPDTNIFPWLDLLPNLAKLNVSGSSFHNVFQFLPETLIELHSSGPFDDKNFTALTEKCPNLESIHFNFDEGTGISRLSVSVANAFFGRCQNLKTIHLQNFFHREPNVSLTALGQLESLEELYLKNVRPFDDVALTAVALGCPRLRTLKIIKITVFEEAVSELDRHPNLMDFEIYEDPFLDENIQKAINERWKLKKFNYLRFRMPSDDSVLREMLYQISSKFETRSYELIQLGFLPLLIKSLGSKNSELQFEAVLALAFAIRTGDQIAAVVEAGVVPELIKLLGTGSEKVQEHSLQALANIINEDSYFRDLCVNLGIVGRLLKMVETEKSIEILRHIRLLFENICQNLFSIDIIKAILPVIEKFVQNSDEEILINSIWALSNIADEDDEQIQLVVDLGVVPRIVSLLDHSEDKVVYPALYAIGNITLGTEEHRELLLDLGVLKMISELISREENNIAKECMRFLANIACTEDRVQTIFDTGLVPAIIQVIVRCAPGCLRDEATRAISNLARYGRSEHIHYLLDYGVISPICKLFRETFYRNDLSDILVGLKNILEKSDTRIEEVCKKIKRCGGFEKIKNLQNHKSEDIKKVAGEIIDKYFPPTEEQDQTLNNDEMEI